MTDDITAPLSKLPIFLDLKGRHCLMIGNGDALIAKARLLISCGAIIDLICNEPSPSLQKWINEGKIRHLSSRFHSGLLDSQALVILSGCDLELARHVHQLGRARNIPCNMVDEPDLCDFFIPAIVNRSPVIAAVSTDGTAPVLAREIRNRLEQELPQGVGKLARIAGEFRDQVARMLNSHARKRAFWEDIFADRKLLEANASEHDIHRHLISKLNGHADETSTFGSIHLIDNPSLDPERLTLKSLRLVQKADVFIFDSNHAAPVIDLARRDVKLVDLREVPVTAPAAFMAFLADKGQHVVRYKDRSSRKFELTDQELSALGDRPYSLEELNPTPPLVARA